MLVKEVTPLEKAQQFIKENRDNVHPRYRPHYHATTPIGWMNDPNGFVYYEGEYHLFYQYYPYDSQWGPMHWGHVKSKDLIHWEELPVALAPDQWYDKDGCFSGSAIEKDGKLYLMYTGHVTEGDQVIQTQCIAVSNDGLTFEKHVNNPVIGEKLLGSEGLIQDFRDPKIIQHEALYYCVVATKTADNRGKILLFSSEDLLEWSFFSVLLEGTSEQGVMWECPDFFHLDGKDVLIMSPIQIKKKDHEYHNISSTMACIGEMNWETGQLHVENFHEMDFGMDYYAPQSLIDDKNRRIVIAWMQMWDRTLPTHDLGHKWAGSMTLPRELRVRNNRLIQRPVSEVYSQLEYQYGSENIQVTEQPVVFHHLIKDNTYMQVVADLSEAQRFTIQLAKQESEHLSLNYETTTSMFTFSRKNFGYEIKGGEQEIIDTRSFPIELVNQQLILEIFRDTNSIEVFVNDQEVLSATFYEKEKGTDLVFVSEGKTHIGSFEVAKVKA